MTVKAYLSQAFLLEQKINSKVAQAESLRNAATKAGVELNGMPPSASRNVSGMEDIIAKMVDLQNDIADHMNRLLDLKREVAEIINQIDSHKHQLVLELRYLCYKNWEDIADELNYQRKYLFRLHKQALEKVDTKRYQKGTRITT